MQKRKKLRRLEERSLWGCGGRAPTFPVNTSQTHKGWSQKPFEAPWGDGDIQRHPSISKGGISSLLLPCHLWSGLLPLLPTSGYITNSARLYTSLFTLYCSRKFLGKSRVKVSSFFFYLIPSIKEIPQTIKQLVVRISSFSLPWLICITLPSRCQAVWTWRLCLLGWVSPEGPAQWSILMFAEWWHHIYF